MQARLYVLIKVESQKNNISFFQASDFNKSVVIFINYVSISLTEIGGNGCLVCLGSSMAVSIEVSDKMIGFFLTAVNLYTMVKIGTIYNCSSILVGWLKGGHYDLVSDSEDYF